MIGTIESEKWLLMGVLMVSSLLNIAYLLPIPLKGFLYEDPDREAKDNGIREAPLPSLVALCLTGLGCIVLFFFPQPLFELAQAFVEASGFNGR